MPLAVNWNTARRKGGKKVDDTRTMTAKGSDDDIVEALDASYLPLPGSHNRCPHCRVSIGRKRD